MNLRTLVYGVGGINILLSIMVVILRRDKDPQATLLWMIITLFMPGFGFLLYLFLGHDYRNSEMFDIKLREDKIINIAVKGQMRDIQTREFIRNNKNLDNYADLINLSLKSDQAFFTSDNKVDVYFWGDEKFSALIEDLKNAKHSIDMEYYIFKSDSIGNEIMEILCQKASEGVQVRLLVDAVGGRFLSKKAKLELEEAGGKVYTFFPSFFKYINFRLNFRNHRKIVVVDDNVGYIGGFNVGDDYLGLYEDMGPWRDTHLRIEGSSVADLKLRFLKDWAYASDFDIDPEIRNIVFAKKRRGNVGVQIVTSGPDTELQNIKNSMTKMIAEAQEEIIIQSPYFVPDQTIMDLLEIQIASGVKVSIMIPGNPDHPFVFPAAMFYLGRLAKLGAKIYLYKYGFIHSKNIMIDHDLSTVGSSNVDIRSFKLNFEANAIIFDEEVNAKLRDQFYKDIEKSELMSYEDYLNRPRLLKLKESISKLLSPIL